MGEKNSKVCDCLEDFSAMVDGEFDLEDSGGAYNADSSSEDLESMGGDNEKEDQAIALNEDYSEDLQLLFTEDEGNLNLQPFKTINKKAISSPILKEISLNVIEPLDEGSERVNIDGKKVK